MKTKLLAGASALVLTLGLSAGAALADSNANNNTPNTAVSQDNSGDAVAGGQNAAQDGAAATSGNALGYDAYENAVASHSSTAVQLEYAPQDGSQVNVGDNNKPATADDYSAAATGKSSAVVTYDDVEHGSSQTIGSGNSTATADDGGAAVGGSGTAVGIHDITIGPDQGDRGRDGFAGLQEGQDGNHGNNGDNGGADDATLAFGANNTVASAHLEETVSGLALAVVGGYEGDQRDGEDGHKGTATIKTGAIYNNSISSLSGANRVVYNTGIANQGRALSIAANNSFGN
jgi:hypothetical protein